MDWRAIISEVQGIAAGPPQAAMRRILETRTLEPDLGLTLERLWRSTTPSGFMATSASGADTVEPARFAPGDRIGAWRIESLIGEGGMARVYRAARADGQFQQTAALKVMHSGGTGLSVQRFEAERKRLAALEHPGISRIIDGGATDDGRPFMVIELVEGEPIDAWARASQPRRADLLRRVIALCEAVSHAHARLILHRDIKASNVLVSHDQRVRLIDFGIAVELDADDAAGFAPLTLATAAPEQLRGETVTTATDIFAIGMLLHQLVTGALPERRADAGVSPDARALGTGDLAAIMGRATAFAPQDRYPSVDALRQDLVSVLERRPVSARGASPLYRLSRAVQRNPLAYGLGVALAIVLSAGLILTRMSADRADAARERAEYALAGAKRALATQSAYADTLVRLFEGEFDTERLRTVLQARADAVHRDREQSPDRAAHLAYAIGTSFLDQGDHASGRDILQRWLDAGYGEEGLQREGRIMLARGLLFTGDGEGALATFEAASQAYVGTPDENSERHIYVLVQLAMGKRTPEAMDRARAGLKSALAADPGPEIAYRHLANLHMIEERSGNLQAAADAIRKAAALQTDSALIEASGDDAVTIGHVRFLLFLDGDIARARPLAEGLLQRAHQKNAVHSEAYALYFLGEAAIMEGRFAEGLALLTRCRELEQSINIDDIVTVSALAEAMVDSGDLEGARALLAPYSPPPGTAPQAGGIHPRLALALAWLTLRAEGPQAASTLLADWGVTRQSLSVNVIGDQRRRRLEARGVSVL
jgi:tetratricopeptide (TPR) repeat protein